MKVWLNLIYILSGFVGSRSVGKIDLNNAIHWDVTNRMFFKSATTPPEITVKLGEKLNVLCPSKFTKNSTRIEDIPQFHIYMVQKTAYDQCTVDGQLIYKCDHPYEQKKLTLPFLQVSPIFGAPIFNPGQSYYFISSEEKMCKSGLKLKVKVTQGDNTRPRLEQQVPITDAFEADDEHKSNTRILILLSITLTAFLCLSISLYFIIKQQPTCPRFLFRTCPKIDDVPETVTFSTENTSTNSIVPVHQQICYPTTPHHHYQSPSRRLLAKSVSVSGLQTLHSPCSPLQSPNSAFSPYKSSMTILQTAKPWVGYLDLENCTFEEYNSTRRGESLNFTERQTHPRPRNSTGDESSTSHEKSTISSEHEFLNAGNGAAGVMTQEGLVVGL